MKISLIITTYNWHNALELVLLSCLCQNKFPDEIIIADDGSDDKTKNLIDNFKEKTNIPIIHSWQEDKGFRLATNRNNAMSKTQYEYIIMIDGDMILHPDFIKNHLQNARKKYFIQGGRVLLMNDISQNSFKNKNIKFNFFTKGIKNRKNSINNKILSKIFSTQDKNLSGIRGCNMSFFKDDIIKVNGFNEDFIGWGREDSEFVARLYNTCIKRQKIKFNCNAYHLFHPENERKMLTRNDEILQNTIDKKLTFCKNGIDKYL